MKFAASRHLHSLPSTIRAAPSVELSPSPQFAVVPGRSLKGSCRAFVRSPRLVLTNSRHQQLTPSAHVVSSHIQLAPSGGARDLLRARPRSDSSIHLLQRRHVRRNSLTAAARRSGVEAGADGSTTSLLRVRMACRSALSWVCGCVARYFTHHGLVEGDRAENTAAVPPCRRAAVGSSKPFGVMRLWAC